MLVSNLGSRVFPWWWFPSPGLSGVSPWLKSTVAPTLNPKTGTYTLPNIIGYTSAHNLNPLWLPPDSIVDLPFQINSKFLTVGDFEFTTIDYILSG